MTTRRNPTSSASTSRSTSTGWRRRVSGGEGHGFEYQLERAARFQHLIQSYSWGVRCRQARANQGGVRLRHWWWSVPRDRLRHRREWWLQDSWDAELLRWTAWVPVHDACGYWKYTVRKRCSKTTFYLKNILFSNEHWRCFWKRAFVVPAQESPQRTINVVILRNICRIGTTFVVKER